MRKKSNTKRPALFTVVPIYNEVANLDALFGTFSLIEKEFIRTHTVEFVLVDDGSTDATSSMVKKLGGGFELTLLAHSSNQGPGNAFGTAFQHLHSRLKDQDLVLTVEGDNTSLLETIRTMARRHEEGYDVILASPYMYGGGILHTSPMRVFLSHVANAFVKEFLGIHGILTMSSFFRLYSGSILKKLQSEYGDKILERAGFECMVEMLLKLIYLEAKISEVPTVLDTKRREGKSKMKITRTIMGYFGLWLRKSQWKPGLSGHAAYREIL